MEVDERELLSEITIHLKYARFLPTENRRETWEEVVERNKHMHVRRYPALAAEINAAYTHVLRKNVLPSMRSLQFAGRALETGHHRMYNCAFMPVDAVEAFSEAMFLLLGGTGVGYSVQRHHIDRLPPLRKPQSHSPPRVFRVPDSAQGWAEAADALLRTYFDLSDKEQQQCQDEQQQSSTDACGITFDFSAIRQKGAPMITSGGRAPGPEPLQRCLEAVERLLLRRIESSEAGSRPRLTPLDAHDILCHLASCVMAGGVRRSALICLFSPEDDEMVACKSGAWWEDNSQRAMANNSAVLLRPSPETQAQSGVSEEAFRDLWSRIKASGSGEPGIFWTNDTNWGTNPCCEIALEPFQFCNLTEVNASTVTSQEDLEDRVRAAAFIGTLQAGYTEFRFLRPIWRETTERAALIGVSLTGIASGSLDDLDLARAAHVVRQENARVAALIGIAPADRTTTVKPAGTTSLVLGTSSGIHAWHARYYIRRIRVSKLEPIYSYLLAHHSHFVEDDAMSPSTTAVVSVPQKAPARGVLREDESAIQLLERVRKMHAEWIGPGHVRGVNTNNVSTTVSVRTEEWDQVADWMWANKDSYNGIAVLPYFGGSYKQAPFEDCSEETFKTLKAHLHKVNIGHIIEDTDHTAFTQDPVCAGGACELVSFSS